MITKCEDKMTRENDHGVLLDEIIYLIKIFFHRELFHSDEIIPKRK